MKKGDKIKKNFLMVNSLDLLIKEYLPWEKRWIIFIDEKFYLLWKKESYLNHLFKKAFLVLKFKASEKSKSLKTCDAIWQELSQKGVNRSDFALIIGGGITLDIGGFIFSTYMRGVPFTFLPTTLLAQVDASLGGKVAINFEGRKNLIGFFNPPEIALIYPPFLRTLSSKDWRCGLAELIKHQILSNEWKKIETNSLRKNFFDLNLIKNSLLFKEKIVKSDPFEENGKRKVLNLGHSVAHALEGIALLKGKKITHGEAVSIGLMAESFLSYKLNLLPFKNYLFLQQLLVSVGLPLQPTFSFSLKQLKLFLSVDKKNSSEKILLVLWGGKKVIIDHAIGEKELKIVSSYFCQQK